VGNQYTIEANAGFVQNFFSGMGAAGFDINNFQFGGP
jgi:hypothetical protein